MAYTSAEFRAKTTELLEGIAANQIIDKGYTRAIIYVPDIVVSELAAYISANPSDPRTIGYESVGEDLFIKPKLPLKVRLQRI